MNPLTQQPDIELWQQVRESSTEAYEALYFRYMPVVFAEIQRRVKLNAEAEDLTQEIFLTLWEKRQEIQIEGRFFSYLFRMARNKVLNYFRDRKIPYEYLEAWENLAEQKVLLTHLPEAFRMDMLEHMERTMEEEREKLPPKMRQAYELRYEQQLTDKAIAQQLNISPHTLRNQLNEIRRRFGNALRKAAMMLSTLLY